MPKNPKNPQPTEEELVDAIAEVLLAIDLSRSPPPSTEPGQVEPVEGERLDGTEILLSTYPDLTHEEALRMLDEQQAKRQPEKDDDGEEQPSTATKRQGG